MGNIIYTMLICVSIYTLFISILWTMVFLVELMWVKCVSMIIIYILYVDYIRYIRSSPLYRFVINAIVVAPSEWSTFTKDMSVYLSTWIVSKDERRSVINIISKRPINTTIESGTLVEFDIDHKHIQEDINMINSSLWKTYPWADEIVHRYVYIDNHLVYVGDRWYLNSRIMHVCYVLMLPMILLLISLLFILDINIVKVIPVVEK